jgi:hypothetical protein
LKAILGVAGLLGLITLAFGERAAQRAAQAILLAMLAVVLFFAIDIATHGMLSSRM